LVVPFAFVRVPVQSPTLPSAERVSVTGRFVMGAWLEAFVTVTVTEIGVPGVSVFDPAVRFRSTNV
jgi:hypothetical protein